MEKNRISFNKQGLYVGLILITFSLFILPQIPYLNLYLPYSITGFMWIGILFIAGLNGISLIKIGVSLFFAMMLLVLINSNFLAEILGNVSYFLLFTGALLLLKDNLKK